MKNYIFIVLAFFYCQTIAADNKDISLEASMKEKSSIYTRNATKLFEFEKRLASEIYKKFDTINCNAWGNSFVHDKKGNRLFKYLDVLMILDRAIKLDNNNFNALYLIAKIQFNNSYLGEGEYDKTLLNTAKQNVLKAITAANNVDQKHTSKKMLEQISSILGNS